MNPQLYGGLAYKFCSTDVLALIVENRTIRFSRADTLNDAFELSPFLMPLDWVEIIQLSKTNMEAARALASHAFQKVCSSLYVTCFSRSYLSDEAQLMWAHYADSHRGVCFCVDFSEREGDMSSEGYYPVKVRYAESLLEERNSRTPTSNDLGMLIGATKPSVWSYEDEVRVVIESDSFDQTRFTKLNDDTAIDVQFSPQNIKKVVFGLHTRKEDVAHIAKVFSDVDDVPVFTKLDIEPLTLKVVEKACGLREYILAQRC